MKTILRTICFTTALPVFTEAAPFKNLGFDQPEYPLGVPNPILDGQPFRSDFAAWMAPGWGDEGGGGIGYNYTQPFYSLASLLDWNYRNTTQLGNPVRPPVVGQFSLGLWPASTGGSIPLTLSQTGDIPTGAQSLRFLYAGSGDFKVYVGGALRPVHFTESLASSDPEVDSLDYYVVDVGLFAGQSAELRFEFFSYGNFPGQDGPSIPGAPNAKMHVLDDISFSPLPAVPEPATWALLGVGLGALLSRGRRR